MNTREKEHHEKRIKKQGLRNLILTMYKNNDSINSIMIKTGYSRSGIYKIIKNISQKTLDKRIDMMQYNITQHNITL